jgi:hypothetical protein
MARGRRNGPGERRSEESPAKAARLTVSAASVSTRPSTRNT